MSIIKVEALSFITLPSELFTHTRIWKALWIIDKNWFHIPKCIHALLGLLSKVCKIGQSLKKSYVFWHWAVFSQMGAERVIEFVPYSFNDETSSIRLQSIYWCNTHAHRAKDNGVRSKEWFCLDGEVCCNFYHPIRTNFVTPISLNKLRKLTKLWTVGPW